MKPTSDYGSLQGKEARRFHEPVLLTYALTQGFRENAPKRVLEPPKETRKPSSPQERFQKVAYKLALVCAREPGGPTVTSVAILERILDKKVVYALACNETDDQRCQEVVEHVEALLAMVSSSSSTERARPTRKQDLWERILLFNKSRIACYLKCFASGLSDYRKKGIKDPLVGTLVRGIEAALGQDPADIECDNIYIDTCNRCLDEIRDNKGAVAQLHRLAKSPAADDETAPGETSWTELPHLFSRLYSYEEAMGCFLDARVEWPRLFQNFEVFFPRYLPLKNTQKCHLSKNSCNLESMIGRFPDEHKRAQMYSAAEDLQNFGIDGRLLRGSKKSSRPVVHSEIILYDWVKHSEAAQGFRFYNDWRFIGASKPTCRVCKYYIESANAAGVKLESTPPIEVRPSHGNIYLNWAFPDSRGPQGSVKGRIWRETLNKTIERIRDDAFRVLMEKSCTGKRHDSNTYDGWSTRASQVGDGVASVSRLSDRFVKGVRIQETHLAGDSEDDDDGGAIL